MKINLDKSSEPNSKRPTIADRKVLQWFVDRLRDKMKRRNEVKTDGG